MMTKISGIMPKKPFEDDVIIDFMMEVESLIAVGENSENTPIRQIRKSKMYGTKRKMIDGTLKKYFWSNLGPHA